MQVTGLECVAQILWNPVELAAIAEFIAFRALFCSLFIPYDKLKRTQIPQEDVVKLSIILVAECAIDLPPTQS